MVTNYLRTPRLFYPKMSYATTVPVRHRLMHGRAPTTGRPTTPNWALAHVSNTDAGGSYNHGRKVMKVVRCSGVFVFASGLQIAKIVLRLFYL